MSSLSGLYSTTVGMLTDTVSSVGNVTRAMNYTSLSVKVSAGLSLPARLKELLLEAGATPEDIDTPEKVMKLASAMLADVDKLI